MTPEQILTLPNTIYNIVTFTDIPTTFNLAYTNKKIYQTITQDNRFITFRLLYVFNKYLEPYYEPREIYSDSDDNSDYNSEIDNELDKLTYVSEDELDLFNSKYNEMDYEIDIVGDPKKVYDRVYYMLSCRYIYYKVAQSETMWHDEIQAQFADIGRKFYHAVYNDKLIYGRKYFNKLYNKYYYAARYCEDRFNGCITYKINLNKLIKYYENPNYTKTIFIKYINKFPKKYLLNLKNTEFAQKFKISQPIYDKYDSWPFAFNYDNFYCSIYFIDRSDIQTMNINIYDKIIKGKSKRIHKFTPSTGDKNILKIDIKKFFMDALYWDDFTAENITEFLLKYLE